MIPALLRRASLRSSASACVAVSMALATIFALATPDMTGSKRDNDSLVRATRGGSQRFDAGDGISHDYEHPDPEADVTDEALVSSAALSVHAPPGVAIMPSVGLLVRPHTAVTLLSFAPFDPYVRTRPHHPALGRAPPSI